MDRAGQAAPEWLLALRKESRLLTALWGGLAALLAGIGVFTSAAVNPALGLLAVLLALTCAYGTADAARQLLDTSEAIGNRCRRCGSKEQG